MVEINNKTRSKINVKLVRDITEKFLGYYKIKSQAVSIAFVGDTVIKRLNKIYRGKNKITDILSFVDDEAGQLGEIIIDYAQIKRQARKFSKSVKAELVFLLIHGLLHLLGYDDRTDKEAKKMEKLAKLAISNL
ncbi:MAG: rRNA maturation RNase YbeY [Patescibacteria group bacterium]|nr:rRNA maturation RNase YbeY [Patescibacteria group bacterium]